MIQPNAYSSAVIQQLGCVITVIILEPNLDTAAFASLESVAAFVHPNERTCILIQTSLCRYQSNGTVTHELAYQRLIESIYDKARPLLRNMIRAGNVRVSILDHVRYQLKSCDYFYSPSNPWLNYYYWNDNNLQNPEDVSRMGEFAHGQDSDLVLTIQRDTVLCHELDARAWKEFSFVGAPWPPSPEWWSCTQLPANWITWHSSSSSKVPPPYPSETDFCTNPNIGPIGNGGFSLRSRLWMQRAIEYCPDIDLSGLTVQSPNRSCSTYDTGNEDIYFATILRGLIHNQLDSAIPWTTRPSSSSSSSSSSSLKLPTMLEAAFFSTETQWLSDIIQHYNISALDIEHMVQKLEWWDGKYDTKVPPSNAKSIVEDGRARFQRLKSGEVNSLGKKPVLPIGLHKVWKYAARDLLGDEESYNHFMKECPYLKDIIPA